ncbi:MAG: ATP-binding cassette domain-containing protein, partial [Ensifer sp. SSB1]|nr:ATP-binding cassette domain-containing protein [Ensifer sp. SSB1]
MVEDMDFSIEAGSRLAILGPNGAGKTSLLRCLYRAVQPNAGRIEIDGVDLWSIS